MTAARAAALDGSAGLPPVELQAPDIGRWRDGGSGVDWVHVFDSGRPGPQAMVQALTHGNEICGAIALDWLLGQGFRPQAGRLTLAFANVAAYARFDPADPFPSRLVDEDYNRVWADETLQGPGNSVELRRARELVGFVDAADCLLDIHSMSEACRPLMVCGTADKNAAFARELGMPGDLLIDTGHPAGLRMVDRGGFADPASPKRALLIECGQHWERAAADVAVDALVRFLGLTGLADAAWVQARLRLPLPPVQHLVRVTEPVVARSAAFRFLVPPVGLSVVASAGTPIAQDGEHVWVTPYDDAVLVMPGTRNLKPGGTAVRIGRFETAPASGGAPAPAPVSRQEIRFDDGAAYETFMGTWSQLVGDAFLQWLAPAPGERWADVGCGNGAFTEMLVERCAPRLVRGLDPSEGQLAFARTRLAGGPVDFVQGNAMALPWTDASFDAAVMALVIFFVPEPARGVAEMVRVVRPGGSVSSYAWDIPGGGFPFQILQEEMAASGNPPLWPPSAEASRMVALQALWEGAGLIDIETRVITVERVFADFASFWQIAQTGPRLLPRFAAMAADELAQLQERVRTRLAPGADGSIVCRARANAIKGTVAAR